MSSFTSSEFDIVIPKENKFEDFTPRDLIYFDEYLEFFVICRPGIKQSTQDLETFANRIELHIISTFGEQDSKTEFISKLKGSSSIEKFSTLGIDVNIVSKDDKVLFSEYYCAATAEKKPIIYQGCIYFPIAVQIGTTLLTRYR